MASVIRIKRSGSTGAPSGLASGELAYSALAGTQSNGGDRLYIGFGTPETNGIAPNMYVIGGKYFTDMLDHVAGTLTASSALIVDSDSKLSQLKVDNLDLNGNTLSSTDTNGNILITPNGTGKTVIGNIYVNDTSTSLLSYIQNASANALAAGTGIDLTFDSGTQTTTISAQLATSSNKGIASFDSTDFTVTSGAVTLQVERIQDIVGGMVSSNTESGISVTYDDAGGKLDFNVNDPVITIAGDVDGYATMTNLGDTTINVTLDTVNTNVGTYGSSTSIPVVTVNGKGLVTAVTTASISTTLNIAGDTGTDGVSLGSDTLTVAGSGSIHTAVTNNQVAISVDTATSSTKGVATFNTSGFVVTSGDVALKGNVVQSVTTDSGTLTPSSNSFSVLGGTGIGVTHSGTTITVAGKDATTSVKGIASFDSSNFTVTSGAVSAKTITLGTSTLTLGSTTTSLAGLQSLDVDNININGNTISSADTNGNIVLSPNGSGSVDVSDSKIIGVATPESGTDAANKAYVDNAVTGLSFKEAVNLIAKTNVALTGSTSTLVIDGHGALDSGDNNIYRLLLTAQSTGSENGIYLYTDNGTTYALVRAADADAYSELIGASVFVMEGVSYANTGWVQTNHYLTGFSGQTWVQFSGAGAYVAGNGLELTGTTFDVVGTTNRIDANANSIDISANYVGQTSITTLGTIGTGTWHGDVVGPTYGGTGVNNGSSTITIGGNLTVSGAYSTTLTVTGATTLTLPTTGTLATLTGTETLTNKTLTTPTINGGTLSGTFSGSHTYSGAVSITDSTASTTTSTGALTVTGGIGIGGQATVNNVKVTATTNSTSTTSGAVIVAGGAGIGGNVYLGSNLTGAGAGSSTLDGFNIDGGTY